MINWRNVKVRTVSEHQVNVHIRKFWFYYFFSFTNRKQITALSTTSFVSSPRLKCDSYVTVFTSKTTSKPTGGLILENIKIEFSTGFFFSNGRISGASVCLITESNSKAIKQMCTYDLNYKYIQWYSRNI